LPRLRRRGLLGEQPDHRDQDAKERDFFHVCLSPNPLRTYLWNAITAARVPRRGKVAAK
jgi:hypothetical protein